MRKWAFIAALLAIPTGVFAGATGTITNWVGVCDPEEPTNCAAPDSSGQIPTTPRASASGGATPAHYLSAASTNATNVKASAGNVYNVVLVNSTSTIYYLKLYDKATTPTCNSDTVVQTYPIPSSPTSNGGGLVVAFPNGMYFSNGISFCLTAGIADNDNTNAATGVAINMVYK